MHSHDRSGLAVALAHRDGAVCHVCGQGADPDDPFEVDHVRPRCAGGSSDLSNLALAHRSCNQAKGTRAVAP